MPDVPPRQHVDELLGLNRRRNQRKSAGKCGDDGQSSHWDFSAFMARAAD
jgi:hypothetical protein